MPVFAWVGAAGAALVAAVAIMLKGGMVERHPIAPGGPDGAGSASGAGIPELADDDPFKRYPRPREGRGSGSPPTQTETGQFEHDTWSSDSVTGDPSVSYSSAGDGDGGYSPTPDAPPSTYPGSTQLYREAGGYVPPSTYAGSTSTYEAAGGYVAPSTLSVTPAIRQQLTGPAPAPTPSTRFTAL